MFNQGARYFSKTVKSSVDVGLKSSFIEAKISEKIKGIFCIWCGVGLIFGINGSIKEHDLINKINSIKSPNDIVKKRMFIVTDHIKATFAYGITLTEYLLIHQHSSYNELIDRKRKVDGLLHPKN